MNETPNNPIGGLPKNFNLGSILSDTDHVDLYAVKAAQNLFNEHSTLTENNQQLTEENQLLEFQATKDEKTGLLNQQAWMHNLENAVAFANAGAPLRAYVADLNGFKRVNDALGHTEGDALLRLVARAFKETFQRSGDVIAHGSRDAGPVSDNIARIGGDEFAIFTVGRELHASGKKPLHEHSNERLEQSKRVNEKLAEILKGTVFEDFDVSLAIGSADHTPNETADSLFARADIAMFENKYADKIDNITDEDMEVLEAIIPFLERLGLRVDSWLKAAVEDARIDRVS